MICILKTLIQELRVLNEGDLIDCSFPTEKIRKSKCMPSCQVLRRSIRTTNQTESSNQTSLFFCCNSAGKRQKRKTLAPSVSFSLWNSTRQGSNGSTDGKNLSLPRSPEQKVPFFLWTLGATGRKSKSGSEKVLSQSRENSCQVLQ
jgi:hypothetical protein